MHPKCFSFSVVSHGSANFIDNFLSHFIKLTIDYPYEIIITFNIPESEEFLSKYSNIPIVIIRNKAIKGFGANHNYAFKKSTGKYFLVVNPDIEIVEFNAKSFIAVLDHPLTGAWAPIVYSKSGIIEDSARLDPTLYVVMKRFLFGLKKCDYPNLNCITQVDWVAGMFIAFKRDIYSKIGGFNEKFHMYYEDADICLRLRANNLKIMLDVNSRVIHFASRKSRKNIKYFLWHVKSVFRILLYKNRYKKYDKK